MQNPLKSCPISTTLGDMIALSDNEALYLLDFTDAKGSERKLSKHAFDPGLTKPIESIACELEDYFNGNLREFRTPLHLSGSEFQMRVWTELMRTPYGRTRSYLEQSQSIGRSAACRAVANANAANRFAIVVPCHRIVNSNGGLGGYAGGAHRKKWLIEHERAVLGQMQLVVPEDSYCC